VGKGIEKEKEKQIKWGRSETARIEEERNDMKKRKRIMTINKGKRVR
jgi:hypothetical protein